VSLAANRAFARSASISRIARLGVRHQRVHQPARGAAISSTARSNAASLACDGLWKPDTLRTNCSERGAHFLVGRRRLEV
jgi:hypothetical protein